MGKDKYNDPINMDRMCVSCSKMFFILVEKEDVEKHINGLSEKAAFPYLDKNELCIITSGMCDGCFVILSKGGSLV